MLRLQKQHLVTHTSVCAWSGGSQKEGVYVYVCLSPALAAFAWCLFSQEAYFTYLRWSQLDPISLSTTYATCYRIHNTYTYNTASLYDFCVHKFTVFWGYPHWIKMHPNIFNYLNSRVHAFRKGWKKFYNLMRAQKGSWGGGRWHEGGTGKKRKTHLSISMQMHASDSFRNPIRLSPRQGVLL